MKRLVKKQSSLFVKVLTFTAAVSAAFLFSFSLNSCQTTEVPDSSAVKTPETPAAGKFDKDEFLASVKELAAAGDMKGALDKYSAVPSSVAKKLDYDIFYMKARLLDVNGKYDEAKNLLLQLEEKYPQNTDLADYYKSICRKVFTDSLQKALSDDDYTAALALYDNIDPSLADDFDLLFLKASLLASDGKLDDAQKLCDSLMTIQPDNLDVMDLASEIARMRGDTKTKNSMLNKILKQDPNNAQANITVAEDYLSNRNYKQARVRYASALKSEPENTDALLGLGMTDYFLEMDDEAEKVLEKIITIDPDYAPAYVYLAKLAYANSKYQVAADNISKAIELDDSNYQYYMDYGMYLRYLGRFDDALASWTKAIEIDSSYFLGYTYRAGLYEEQEMYTQALDDYKKVVELNPGYYYAYESMGLLALHNREWTVAREAFAKCRSYNADNVSYPLLVTYCYYMENDPINAKKYSESVYRKMNRDTIEYSMLRLYHDQAGDKPLPQRIAALSNSNTRGKMYFYLALFYDMLNGKQSAAQFYTKVLDMNSPMFFEYKIAEWNLSECRDYIEQVDGTEESDGTDN